ncbi:hypothetical protein [Gulosibacter chungangensis]|uniref:Uncharacterized protein n=1 Tax=Gulosibacter chungangensis TaxID=979746 RepID=A0A7J5B9A1_9MICO|nr:hypothetical protein [Gulosibacter chungangensis]KAB1641146.1 hypothetical protein F8O05_13000 [Gulosibacter chungangensis]
MFGWIRKLTQRAAVEESTDTSSLLAPDNSAAETHAQQAPLPRTDSIASSQAIEPAPRMVDVYTPEPMPEPPTSELPEPQLAESFEAPGTVEEEVVFEDDHTFTPVNSTERTSAFAAPATSVNTATVTVAETAVAEAPVTELENAAAEAEAIDERIEDASEAAAAIATETAEATEASTELEPSPLEAEFDGLLSAPSPRPAMPLSAHPNFAGLGLAQWEPIAPRLLEPEAALTPAAQEELIKLFDDLFGPCGRYRLEWRTDRRAGDDAMFAEIMTADLVRRVQNTIADVAELERPEPPKAIQAAFVDLEEDGDADEAFRQAS